MMGEKCKIILMGEEGFDLCDTHLIMMFVSKEVIASVQVNIGFLVAEKIMI
jgi:hypothetical protein